MEKKFRIFEIFYVFCGFESLNHRNFFFVVSTGSTTAESLVWIDPETSINSLNIPDGPINIHVVAIDNAGNISKGLIATKVENNRPRIAKVMLATDYLNGNGKFDYDASAAPITGETTETLNERTADNAEFGEFSFYSAMEAKSTNLKSEVELKSESFKVISGFWENCNYSNAGFV